VIRLFPHAGLFILLISVDARADSAATEALDTAYAALRNQEYDVAYDLFAALAAQDNAQAQHELAALYHRGAGVEVDIARAARWYARAAELGHADAQYRLGNMFLMGEGVRQSDSEALHWYEQAAQQGHNDARNNLASLQRISAAKTRTELEREAATLPPLAVKPKSEPGKKTEPRGFFKRWFGKDDSPAPDADTATQAQPRTHTDNTGNTGDTDNNAGVTTPPPAPTEAVASAADASAAGRGGATSARPAPLANSTAVSNYELGLAYAVGDTLAQDYEQAFAYFSKSAQQGYAPAQYRLGAAYANGDGTGQDPEQALDWYRKAADQGHTAARRSLAQLYLQGLGRLPPNKPLALAWYTLLAEDGNQLDLHRRDSLLQELSEEDISRAEELAAELRRE